MWHEKNHLTISPDGPQGRQTLLWWQIQSWNYWEYSVSLKQRQNRQLVTTAMLWNYRQVMKTVMFSWKAITNNGNYSETIFSKSTIHDVDVLKYNCRSNEKCSPQRVHDQKETTSSLFQWTTMASKYPEKLIGSTTSSKRNCQNCHYDHHVLHWGTAMSITYNVDDFCRRSRHTLVDCSVHKLQSLETAFIWFAECIIAHESTQTVRMFHLVRSTRSCVQSLEGAM